MPAHPPVWIPFLLGLLLVSMVNDSAAESEWRIDYWNDTTDIERLVTDGWALAQDDYVTVGFAAGWTPGPSRSTPAWRATLAGITLKDAGTRTDLLALVAQLPFDVYGVAVTVRLGGMASGNFGGAGLQNGWHALRRHSIVDLRYPAAPRVGPLLGGELAWAPVPSLPFRPSLHLRSSHAPTVGYHRHDMHLSGGGEPASGWRVDTVAGYTAYNNLHASFAPAFQSGWTYGVAVGVSPWSNATITAWWLANLYRNDQSVPGISLRWTPNHSGPFIPGRELL